MMRGLRRGFSPAAAARHPLAAAVHTDLIFFLSSPTLALVQLDLCANFAFSVGVNRADSAFFRCLKIELSRLNSIFNKNIELNRLNSASFGTFLIFLCFVSLQVVVEDAEVLKTIKKLFASDESVRLMLSNLDLFETLL